MAIRSLGYIRPRSQDDKTMTSDSERFRSLPPMLVADFTDPADRRTGAR